MPLNFFKSFSFISVYKNYDEWSVVNALERKSGVKNGTSFLDHLKIFFSLKNTEIFCAAMTIEKNCANDDYDEMITSDALVEILM